MLPIFPAQEWTFSNRGERCPDRGIRKKPASGQNTNDSRKKNIYAKAAAQRSAELEAIRKRTEELRELRLAQEKRGRVRQKVVGARVAQPYTKVLSEK